MGHPLEEIIENTDRFVLIGDSSEDRFPAMSFHNYISVGKPFYCLDMGGLTESRGGSKGRKVYTSVAEIPEDRSELAVIWVKPRTAPKAVDLAHEAGCTKIWFSFGSGHRDAVARARQLGMEVVEIGRCPVYYMKDQIPACKAHTMVVKLSGSYRRPPQLNADAKRRELF